MTHTQDVGALLYSLSLKSCQCTSSNATLVVFEASPDWNKAESEFVSRYSMCVEGSLERGGGENDIVWGLNSSPGSHTPDARLFRLLHFHKILELKSLMRKHSFHKVEIGSSKPRMEIYF